MAPESCNLGKDEAEIIKSSSPTPPLSSSLSSSSASSSPSPSNSCPPAFLPMSETLTATAIEASFLPRSEEEAHTPAQLSKRCSTCLKRIGLTGFRCRCGDLFCARHRYSDTHDCSFDYKAAGREEISKANPVIRAAKIIKI